MGMKFKIIIAILGAAILVLGVAIFKLHVKPVEEPPAAKIDIKPTPLPKPDVVVPPVVTPIPEPVKPVEPVVTPEPKEPFELRIQYGQIIKKR